MATKTLPRWMPRSSAQWMSLGLALTGFALLIIMEYAAAQYAYAVSSNERDAALKIAFSLAFGFAAFAGGIVATAKSEDPRVGVSKGAGKAWFVTIVCFCVAAVNFASYVAFARAEKAAAETRQSPAYTQALADLPGDKAYARDVAADFTLAGAAAEALAKTEAIIAAGEAPRAVVWGVSREDRKAGEVVVEWYDLLVAFVSGAIVIGLGSAYRMPAPAYRQRRRSKKKTTTRKPRLVVSN